MLITEVYSSLDFNMVVTDCALEDKTAYKLTQFMNVFSTVVLTALTWLVTDPTVSDPSDLDNLGISLDLCLLYMQFLEQSEDRLFPSDLIRNDTVPSVDNG